VNTFRPKWFAIEELVGPDFYVKWGDRAWEWLRPELLITLDQMRDQFGSITINNWKTGGVFRESCLRDFKTDTGAGMSLHKFGCAADCKFKSITPIEVQSYILSRPEKFPWLTTLEDAAITKTWLHVDVRNHSQQRIWVVKP
jgi:hypothetical protein